MGMNYWELSPSLSDDEYKALKASVARRKKSVDKVLDAYNAELEALHAVLEAKWKRKRNRAYEARDSIWHDERRIHEYEAKKQLAALGFEEGDIVVDEFGNKYRVDSIWDRGRGRIGVSVTKLNKDGSPGTRSLSGSPKWTKWEPTA